MLHHRRHYDPYSLQCYGIVTGVNMTLSHCMIWYCDTTSVKITLSYFNDIALWHHRRQLDAFLLHDMVLWHNLRQYDAFLLHDMVLLQHRRHTYALFLHYCGIVTLPPLWWRLLHWYTDGIMLTHFCLATVPNLHLSIIW